MIKKVIVAAALAILAVSAMIIAQGHCYTCGNTGVVVCYLCDGSGAAGTCFTCHGVGFTTKDCFGCNGSGYTYGGNRCYQCHGTGVKNERCWACRGTGAGARCVSCNGTGRQACRSCRR